MPVLGAIGEQLAREYLENMHYRFLEANFSCKMGEIDLIMQDGSCRVMIEVRLRSPLGFGDGADSVHTIKQRKLIKTALFYQQHANYWGDIRFDVVSIARISKGNMNITHIKDAFTA